MYTPIIGMEIHVELNTKSKMFCSCANNPEALPNTHICEICTGQPGSLPVPNKTAIGYTVLIGKALNCSIREKTKFDRKHYFYPDLPKGYQISQYDEPIAENGAITLTFPLEDNIRDSATIGIRRAHLEEDTAKLLHDTDGSTLVDFNRSSVPLVEIVTNPDFKTPIEAKTFCQELRTLLKYLGVSDADMEKGHMRCEANISVQEAGKFEIVSGEVKPLGEYKLYNKVELKNLNSFKAVEKGIQFEIDRQTDLIKNGKTWDQETRGWDALQEKTVHQRTKENAADYRYFPEPDIPPFSPLPFAEAYHMPELPIKKRERFKEEYGLSYADAKLLSDTKQWANFTEAVMSELVDWISSTDTTKKSTDAIKENDKEAIAKLAGGWMTSKLMGALNERDMQLEQISCSPENFAELISLIYTKKVNSTNAQKILIEMIEAEQNTDPTHIMEDKGYGQVSDTSQLDPIIDQVIKAYPAQVTAFKGGKEPIIAFLIGMVMKATEGSANPTIVEQLLRNKLSQ